MSRSVSTEVSSYIQIPKSRSKEFWSSWRISHIRQLAQTGNTTNEIWLPSAERTQRVLDHLFLKHAHQTEGVNDVRMSVPFVADSSLELSSPLYLGDMSFGALSGTPNIAIASAADITGILAGTGEGGVQEETGNCERITVQWASARFGVDISTVRKGQAVVIKIGQGAKPGIGGHLPGVKVTRSISEARRIPIGRDAISPAPHHDIYSIEDLGQRILALKEATGHPVLVKVGATNYIPYIASGIARMGAAGIIIDGAGAGTGAAPSIVKDNVGIPIELAVASVDSILKREGLRKGFTVIAAGKVSCPEDSLKLMALGADITSLGTASLLALGCLMVHKCHLGFCPAVLTNKITENPAKVLSLNQAVTWLSNLVAGWTDEMKSILRSMGLSDIRELQGRRDLLSCSKTMNSETRQILGVSNEIADETADLTTTTELVHEQNVWTLARVSMLRDMAGTTGKSAAEAVISSMGSIAPPFVDEPARLTDWLVSDGAQVTRPSIDPYREEIEITTRLPGSTPRLSAPLFFTHLPTDMPKEVYNMFARTALAMGLLFDQHKQKTTDTEKYSERTISSLSDTTLTSIDMDDYRTNVDRIEQSNIQGKKNQFLRIPSSKESLEWIGSNLDELENFSSIIIDKDSHGSNLPIELTVSTLDQMLKKNGARSKLGIMAEDNSVRGSDDIFKVLALGADCVGLGKAALIAIGFEESNKEVIFDASKSTKHLENLVVALMKDLKLLAGAAGVSSLASSLVGNRELLRSVDLDPTLRKKLGVKPAGAT
ncbi:MAG TPA: glutamate synthase-related protein [Candidatus Bathyarchaeia archaeon]|nr:glutamate synthase-related protein [Candidatus Bathyarchaeia archaeon]